MFFDNEEYNEDDFLQEDTGSTIIGFISEFISLMMIVFIFNILKSPVATMSLYFDINLLNMITSLF